VRSPTRCARRSAWIPVRDPGSSNGIVVNGKDVPPGGTVPLRDGDQIYLGAWTVITVIRD
jgi:predicted component of type VI protein secretion system